LLVFVAAERRELDGLLRHLHGISKPGWPLDFARLGRLNGRPVALVANGPGPKLAGEAVNVVREHEKMEGLISTGFCGGLQAWLQPCDIFVATEVIGAGAAPLPASSRPFQTGRLLSIDRVASTASGKMELGKRADAVEMEALGVAERARQWNIPFYAVRVVTDTCLESFPLDFNAMRSADGRFSRAKILAEGLRKPATVFPELMKLNMRTKRAARALGDFLADARF
jgi:adenosylhomocysteine nucleosidase